MPSSGFGPSIWNGGYTPLTPWERPDIDPGFEIMPFIFPDRKRPPQSPGGNNGPGMMAAVAGANPNYGIGDPGGSFVGIGAMTRACNVPNALQPTIPGGGLLGPDGYVPIWSTPGYDITPPVVSGALGGGGFNPTMPPIMPFYPPSIDDLTRDPNGDRSLENAPGYDPFSFTGSAVGSLIGVTGYGSGGYSSSSTTGSQGSSGSGWHLGQGNHGHTITSPEGYTLTTLRAGMDYGFEDVPDKAGGHTGGLIVSGDSDEPETVESGAEFNFGAAEAMVGYYKAEAERIKYEAIADTYEAAAVAGAAIVVFAIGSSGIIGIAASAFAGWVSSTAIPAITSAAGAALEGLIGVGTGLYSWGLTTASRITSWAIASWAAISGTLNRWGSWLSARGQAFSNWAARVWTQATKALSNEFGYIGGIPRYIRGLRLIKHAIERIHQYRIPIGSIRRALNQIPFPHPTNTNRVIYFVKDAFRYNGRMRGIGVVVEESTNRIISVIVRNDNLPQRSWLE